MSFDRSDLLLAGLLLLFCHTSPCETVAAQAIDIVRVHAKLHRGERHTGQPGNAANSHWTQLLSHELQQAYHEEAHYAQQQQQHHVTAIAPSFQPATAGVVSLTKQQRQETGSGTTPAVPSSIPPAPQVPQPPPPAQPQPTARKQPQKSPSSSGASAAAAAASIPAQPAAAKPPTRVHWEGVPPDGRAVTLAEQLEQAAVLHMQLGNEELVYATNLMGQAGSRHDLIPARSAPEDYPDGYVAVCTVVKDQQQDLLEWLEYHRFIGVGKVYVYDNNSTEPLADVMAGMLHDGYVEYTFFAGSQRYGQLFRTSNQWRAYNDCLMRHRYRHKFIAFIDVDEFIVLQQQHTEPAGRSGSDGGGAARQDINQFMRQYEQYGGLAINWLMFGSSGHKEQPAGGVLLNYQDCLPVGSVENRHVKVIVNTDHVLTVGDDPHQAYYKDPANYYTVDELGNKVVGPRTKAASHSKVALYHYALKSEADYAQKMQRGSAAGNHKSRGFFTAVNRLATKKCTHGVELGLQCCPSVKAALGPERQQQLHNALKDKGVEEAPAAAKAQQQ